MCVCCTDFKKAFDRVCREDVWRILYSRGRVDVETVEVFRPLYRNNKSVVRVNNEESRECDIKIGLKQGCVLSKTILVSVALDEGLKKGNPD